jgi:hypothetical protein
MTHGTMRAILDTSISPLEPIRTQPFACDFWPKEDAARTVLASQALFPECREASALQRSGDFVLILAGGRACDPVRASMRRRRDAHGAAGEDVDAREAADGSVASGGLPKADPHRGPSGHDCGRIDL